MSDTPTKKGGVYLVYPHMEEFRQYAVDHGFNHRPWVVEDRKAMLRQVKEGRGRGLIRIWTPSIWTAVPAPTGEAKSDA